MAWVLRFIITETETFMNNSFDLNNFDNLTKSNKFALFTVDFNEYKNPNSNLSNNYF